jgi:uncharacterized repeat protein (TIGR03837 family)
VCWRLAADLGSRGQAVRLVVDDARALAWMAPEGAPGVTVLPWGWADGTAPPGDVVVEAFGCELPEQVIARMALDAANGRPHCGPVWINLEYLSAEANVERNHRLPSPQMAGRGAGLMKWFFYPGFTPGTGGLIRERGLMESRRAFDASGWLRGMGIFPEPAELVVSLLAYDVTRLKTLLPMLGSQPKLLLVAQGMAASTLDAVRGLRDVRIHTLPWLSQVAFDRLLWSCDLNLVRGEDSFVRAQWAGKPLIWQIYPQHDGVHAVKLEAFMARYLAAAPRDLTDAVRRSYLEWNALDSPTPAALPSEVNWKLWREWSESWQATLAGHSDLTSQLIDFVVERR